MWAWNMDGSSSAKPPTTKTWIREYEVGTGSVLSACAFEGCERRAAHGGHVWIRGVSDERKCWIAPICAECNDPKTDERRQGGNSRLRANIYVLRTDVTDDMRNAMRRYSQSPQSPQSPPARRRVTPPVSPQGPFSVHGRGRRNCERCRVDISNRPLNHTRCLECFQNAAARRCVSCSDNISDRPPSHFLCLPCYQRMR